ncbi:MAG: DUF6602 domain-containing protein [Myxococcota bacterium]
MPSTPPAAHHTFHTALITEAIARYWNLRTALWRAKALNHNGALGSERETVFASFLNGFIPKRHEMGTGEIINCSNETSTQLDIVLASDLATMFRGTSQTSYPIESVLAVLECKSDLDYYKDRKTGQYKGEFEKATSAALKLREMATPHIRNNPYRLNTGTIGAPEAGQIVRDHPFPAYYLLSRSAPANPGTIVDWADNLVERLRTDGDPDRGKKALPSAIFAIERGYLLIRNDQFLINSSDKDARHLYVSSKDLEGAPSLRPIDYTFDEGTPENDQKFLKSAALCVLFFLDHVHRATSAYTVNRSETNFQLSRYLW